MYSPKNESSLNSSTAFPLKSNFLRLSLAYVKLSGTFFNWLFDNINTVNSLNTANASSLICSKFVDDKSKI